MRRLGLALALVLATITWRPASASTVATHPPLQDEQEQPATASALEPFGPPEPMTAEAFQALVDEAAELGVGSRQRLLRAGRGAVPAIINAMLPLDLARKTGARAGKACHGLLVELTGQELLAWSPGVEPEAALANRGMVEHWYRTWARCEEDPHEWWRLLGLRPGPTLDAITSAGFPGTVEVEVLRFQERVDRDLSVYEARSAALRAQLDERQAAVEARARAKLIEDLPSSWSDAQLAGQRGVLEPAVLRLELEQGVDLPWPLGLRASFTDTLRKSQRDARVDQRTIEVPGLAEDLEVSVVTHGRSQYGIVPISVPWATARRICEENGGHLACIETAEELACIQELFLPGQYRTHGVLGLSEWDKLFWVGATDAHEEGDWAWLDGRKVEATAWVQPVESAAGGLQPWDLAQPGDTEGSQHGAALVCYTGDPELDPPLEPTWGLLSWYEGFPGRFICEWGIEPPVGPWPAQTHAVVQPFLEEYFEDLFDGEQAARALEKKLEKQTAKGRRELSREQSAARKQLTKSLKEQLRANSASWTPRQAHLTQRMLWLLEDDACFPHPRPVKAPPPLPGAVRFMGRWYKLMTRPATWHGAQRHCAELGGRLASLGLAGIETGGPGPRGAALRTWLETDLEGALYRALLEEHSLSRAWLGYRFHGSWGWTERPLAGQWVSLPGLTPVPPGMLQEELAWNAHSLGTAWGVGHAAGAVFEGIEPGAHLTVVRPDPGQVEFPDVFGLDSPSGLPAHAVKVRVDRAPASSFRFHGAEDRLEWVGPAFDGEETLVIYGSPISAASVDRRLPYLCVWDA